MIKHTKWLSEQLVQMPSSSIIGQGEKLESAIANRYDMLVYDMLVKTKVPRSISNTKASKSLSALVELRRARIGSPKAEDLLKLATGARSPRKKRSEAIELIGLLGLLGQLTKEHTAKIVATLVQIVINEERVLAWDAAVALGYIDDRKSVPSLIQAAKKATNAENKRAVIYALGALGDPRAVGVLTAVLANRRWGSKLRAEAAEALGSCARGSIRALKALNAACADPTSAVRLSSASALGLLRNRLHSRAER